MEAKLSRVRLAVSVASFNFSRLTTWQVECVPLEILGNILNRIPRSTLLHVALTSRRLSLVVTPHIYHSIELVDRCNQSIGNDHDNTPIINILRVLAQNTLLAPYVRELLHQCHPRLPNPWYELDQM